MGAVVVLILVFYPVGHIKVVRLIIHDDFSPRHSSTPQSFFFDLEAQSR